MTKRLLAPLLALALAAAACGAVVLPPRDARTTVVSLIQVDCADCGDKLILDLRARPGVYTAIYDRRKAEIAVTASPTFDVFTTVKSLAAAEGFDALLGAGKGAYLPERIFPQGADVAFPAKDGADVPSLDALVVKGKVTIVDFAASWCGPCRLLDQHVAELLAVRKDVAYRRLDVGDWDSPLARHYLKRVPQLPFVIVFDPNGKRIDDVVGLDLAKLDAAVAVASKSLSP